MFSFFLHLFPTEGWKIRAWHLSLQLSWWVIFCDDAKDFALTHTHTHAHIIYIHTHTHTIYIHIYDLIILSWLFILCLYICIQSPSIEKGDKAGAMVRLDLNCSGNIMCSVKHTLCVITSEASSKVSLSTLSLLLWLLYCLDVETYRSWLLYCLDVETYRSWGVSQLDGEPGH